MQHENSDHVQTVLIEYANENLQLKLALAQANSLIAALREQLPEPETDEGNEAPCD